MKLETKVGAFFIGSLVVIGFLVMQMETELHAFVVSSIARAIARDEYLNLALESSSWHHAAIWALSDDLRACGFSYDMRKAEPYELYDRFDFEIPTADTGDCCRRLFRKQFLSTVNNQLRTHCASRN